MLCADSSPRVLAGRAKHAQRLVLATGVERREAHANARKRVSRPQRDERSKLSIRLFGVLCAAVREQQIAEPAARVGVVRRVLRDL